jgi:hypothetical protein
MARTAECFHAGDEGRRSLRSTVRGQIKEGGKSRALALSGRRPQTSFFPPHFLFILIQIVATTTATNIKTMMMRMESVLFLVESLL